MKPTKGVPQNNELRHQNQVPVLNAAYVFMSFVVEGSLNMKTLVRSSCVGFAEAKLTKINNEIKARKFENSS